MKGDDASKNAEPRISSEAERTGVTGRKRSSNPGAGGASIPQSIAYGRFRLPASDRATHLATVRFTSPRSGTYRFEIGYGGNLAFLADLGFDPVSGQHTGGRSFTFDCTAEALTQSPAWLYIPRGTRSLDLEVWDSSGVKTLTLFRRPSESRGHGVLVPAPTSPSRTVDIGARGTHRIPLEPDETGMLATISGNGFAFPYVYSVPLLWAKSPAQLIVPRGVATADALTIR